MLDHISAYVGTDPLVFSLATLCLGGMVWAALRYAHDASAELQYLFSAAVLIALICGTAFRLYYAWLYIPILLTLACLSLFVDFSHKRMPDAPIDRVEERLDAVVHMCVFAGPIMIVFAINSSTVGTSSAIGAVFVFVGVAALAAGRSISQAANDVGEILQARDASHFRHQQSLTIQLEAANASFSEARSEAQGWSKRARDASQAARMASQAAREAGAERDRREAENTQMLKEAARKAGMDRLELDAMREQLQATHKKTVVVQGRRLFHTLTQDQTRPFIELLQTELLKEGAIQGHAWMKITHLVALESVNSELQKWDVTWVEDGLDLRPGVLWEGIQSMVRQDEVLVKPESVGGTEWTEQVSLSKTGARMQRQSKGSAQVTNIGAQFFGGRPKIDQVIAQVSGNAYYKTAGEDLQLAVKKLLQTAGQTAEIEPSVQDSRDLALALDAVANATDKKGLKQTIISVMGLSSAIGRAAEPILESAKTIHDLLAS